MCLLAQRNHSNWSKNVRIFELLLTISIFAIISAFRYDVGTDWQSYDEWSNRIASGLEDNEDWQALFVWFGSMFSGIFNSSAFFFGAIGVAQIVTLGILAYRQSLSSLLLLALILSNGICLFWFNGLRQIIAVNLGFLYLIELNKRKIWSSIIYFILAYGFHKSAIVLIPLSAVFLLEKTLYNIFLKIGLLSYFVCLYLGTKGAVENILLELSSYFLEVSGISSARMEVGLDTLLELKKRDISFGLRRVLNAYTITYLFYLLRKTKGIRIASWIVVFFWIGELYKVLIEESISDFMRFYYFFLPFKIFVLLETLRTIKFSKRGFKTVPHIVFVLLIMVTSLVSAYSDYRNIFEVKHVYFQFR